MAQTVDGIKTAKVSPAFLHGNSTSHTWAFSAIAELIDNAYDPDVNASELWIDKRTINGLECLTFVDNGNGMTEDKLYKMLSFGFCEKVPMNGIQPIGHYGNGFKSGSMRLGMDAMVFTRSQDSTSVGFLSQTYLKAINAEAVVVPVVTWNLPSMTRRQTPQVTQNLNAILKHSLFNKEKDLFNELKSLEKMRTGTNIIIYNLKKDELKNLELDFMSDKTDIRNPETHRVDLTSINRPINLSAPEHRKSLREYCSILFLKPRMKIVLRGQKVVTKLISKSLSKTEIDVYKPTWLPRPIKLTFGFTDNQETESYGLMMYHKNRLIRAYEKIGCQNKANDHGVGVVGVVEANFLEPIHNKQEFNRTDRYSAFMQNVALKLNDYYYEKTQSTNPEAAALNVSQLPDWTWVQCDNCLSWRRLPTGYTEKLPDKWVCWMNPDAAFNRCDIPEEPEDDDEALQPTYRKTYKKKEEEKKRLAKMAEERKRVEKEMALKQKEKILKKRESELKRQKEELTVSSSNDKSDKKPTIRDLQLAHVKLQQSQQKLVEQERLIKQLEDQKKDNETKKQAMLRLAESVKLGSIEGQQLADKVTEMQGTSSTTVSSSSNPNTLRAPTKRKQPPESTAGSGGKTIKIKTEDGGSISVTTSGLIDLTVDSDNEEQSSPNKDTASPSAAKKPCSPKVCKTWSSDQPDKESVKKDQTDSVKKDNKQDKSDPKPGTSKDCAEKEAKAVGKKEKDSEGYTEMEVDVKPNKDELDKQIKEAMKPVLAHRGSQTVPTVVKFASPEEVKLQKLSPLEQKQMLLQKARELDETKKDLKNLQSNIWQLLKIIVPDFDYGDPDNIESIILDFIRVNGDTS